MFLDMSKTNRAGSESVQILLHHWRWLRDQGPSYKHQAASAKRQAASLTRKNYNVIVSYKRKDKRI
jgi:hypothetical protein